MYIGSLPAYQASGVRPRDEFTADGTQICFPLSQSVPGSFESGVTIVLDNVPQQPVEAFTVVDTRTLTLTSISGTFTKNETITGGTSSATGTVLKVNLGSIVIRVLTGTFSSSEGITGGSSSATATTTNVSINTGSGILFSEIPASGAVLYVVHEGNATYNLVPAAASVSATQLADNLRNFTVDTFTGDGTTTAFTLTDTPSSANALLVMVDGIVQTRTTNYTLAINVVTFTGAPDSGSAITVIHLGFSTVSRTGLVDGSVTTAKIADGSITTAKLNSTLDLSGKTITYRSIVAGDIATGAITSAKILDGTIALGDLSATGTPDNTKFLRGDNSWQVVAVTPTAVSDQTNSSTGYFALPTGTTGQRPGTPANGMIRYNSTTAYNEIYQSSAWATIASIGNIASTSTAYSASQTTATTGSTSASTYTDWGGGNITLPAGTYLFSFNGVLEVQNISSSGSTTQGIFSCLIVADSSNNYIYGTSGNYVHLNNTYNIESMGNAFIYTVSATTSYKLRFGYGQNSGSPTTSNIYLRGNIGINNTPITLTAIKLY